MTKSSRESLSFVFGVCGGTRLQSTVNITGQELFEQTAEELCKERITPAMATKN